MTLDDATRDKSPRECVPSPRHRTSLIPPLFRYVHVSETSPFHNAPRSVISKSQIPGWGVRSMLYIGVFCGCSVFASGSLWVWLMIFWDSVKIGKNLHTRRLDYNWFYALTKVTGAFLFRIFGGFLHVPATQICCLPGVIISETHIITTTIYTIRHDPPQ
jgi:hypothetical protein